MSEKKMVVHECHYPAPKKVATTNETSRVVCDEELSAKILSLPGDCDFSIIVVACCSAKVEPETKSTIAKMRVMERC